MNNGEDYPEDIPEHRDRRRLFNPFSAYEFGSGLSGFMLSGVAIVGFQDLEHTQLDLTDTRVSLLTVTFLSAALCSVLRYRERGKAKQATAAQLEATYSADTYTHQDTAQRLRQLASSE